MRYYWKMPKGSNYGAAKEGAVGYDCEYLYQLRKFAKEESIPGVTSPYFPQPNRPMNGVYNNTQLETR